MITRTNAMPWPTCRAVLVLGSLAFACCASEAVASLVFSSSSATQDTDGPVAASAHFEIDRAGELTVTLTNTQTHIGSIGQALSEFYFTWNGPGSITALTTVAGTPVEIKSSGAYTLLTPVSGSGGDYHWGFGVSGGAVAIETVASSGNDAVAPGGKPNYLIVGAPGGTAYGSGSPSLDQHNPSFYESAQFVFADSALVPSIALTASTISNVSFGFGTGPEAKLGGTLTSVISPEPTTFVLFGAAVVGLVVSRCRRPARRFSVAVQG